MDISNATSLFREAKSLISESLRDMDPSDQKSVIILGKTGVGKSTLINLLAGTKLKTIHDKGITQIDATQPLPNIEIGHSKQSKTSIPHKWKDENKVSYWDVPGFKDPRRLKAQEIANAVVLQELFKSNQEVKIVLMAKDADFTKDRGQDVIDLIEQVDRLFRGHIDPIRNAICLVVSHAPSDREEKHVVSRINRLIKDRSLKGAQKDLLETLIPKDTDPPTFPRISLFKIPDSDDDVYASRDGIAKNIHKEIGYTKHLDVDAAVSKECQSEVIEAYAILIKEVNHIRDRFLAFFENCIRVFVSTNKNKALLEEIVSQLDLSLQEKSVMAMISKCIEVAKRCGGQLPDKEVSAILAQVDGLEAIPFLEQFISEKAQLPMELMKPLREGIKKAKSLLHSAIKKIETQEAKKREEKALIAAEKSKKEAEEARKFQIATEQTLQESDTARMSLFYSRLRAIAARHKNYEHHVNGVQSADWFLRTVINPRKGRPIVLETNEQQQLDDTNNLERFATEINLMIIRHQHAPNQTEGTQVRNELLAFIEERKNRKR